MLWGKCFQVWNTSLLDTGQMRWHFYGVMPVCEGGNSCLSVWPLPALSTSTDALCTNISGHVSCFIKGKSFLERCCKVKEDCLRSKAPFPLTLNLRTEQSSLLFLPDDWWWCWTGFRVSVGHLLWKDICWDPLHIKKNFFFAYLFTFGCAGSSLPQGLFSSCGEWASYWGPSFAVKHGLWGTCAQQLQLPGSRAPTW